MTKPEAIRWFKEIQGGAGVDRTSFPEEMKGRIAKRVWNDSTFTYGIEYGVLIALMTIFKITPDDLRHYPIKNKRGIMQI